MKTFIALVVLTFVAYTPEAHALFGHVEAEKTRRQEAEQRVIQEQQNSGQLLNSNQSLHIAVTMLSAGVVISLVIGAAIGSKTRKDHDAHL